MIHRPRRLRRTPNIRALVQETHIQKSNLIYPLFITHGKGIAKPIGSMPGIFQYSLDNALKDIEEAYNLGIRSVLLFGIPEHKDEFGSEAYDDSGIIQQSIKAIKAKYPDLIVIPDVCLCEYTSHGHCGIVHKGDVLNDETVELLVKESVSYAKAGADIIAPSDMMDGRVFHIRQALDKAGYSHIPIMSYSVKYASAFYGPFREAAESTPAFGDRRTYQMDVNNSREGMREAFQDIDEGADIIMVKPAGAYLDIIYKLRNSTDLPIAAYQVSGEYSMIKAAGANGWLDEQRAMMESIIAIKRAGADIIITYFAKDIAKIL
jgi:porphobilinogen synthase